MRKRVNPSTTVLREPNFRPEPWLGPCRLATTRPARPRGAGAESRSFERCAPTTSCRDPTPASTTPLPAHGPCTARIRTSATAMRTRCGEGDLVGGWHAGASPFIPITRWVTKREASSAYFAHAYTPFGRFQRLPDEGSRSSRSSCSSSLGMRSSCLSSFTTSTLPLAAQVT